MSGAIETCPETPTIFSCGLVAADWLVKNNLIVLDTLKMTGDEFSLIIDYKGAPTLEVLNTNRAKITQDETEQGVIDKAATECIACGKCINIVDVNGIVFIQDAFNATTSSPNNPHFTLKESVVKEAIDFFKADNSIQRFQQLQQEILINNDTLHKMVFGIMDQANIMRPDIRDEVVKGSLAVYKLLQLQAAADSIVLPLVTFKTLETFRDDYSKEPLNMYIMRQFGALKVLDREYIKFFDEYMLIDDQPIDYMKSSFFLGGGILTYSMLKHALYK